MQAQVSLWFMYLTSINTTYNIKINKNNVVLFHSERTKLVTYYCIRLGDLLFVFLMGCGIFYTIRINNCIIVYFCLLSIEYLLQNLKRFNRFDSLYYKKRPNHKKKKFKKKCKMLSYCK